MNQRWNSALYDDNHAFVTRYGEDVLELLAPQNGEKILDLGCGTGHLTAKIAERGAQVFGLDSSAPMLAVARENYPEIPWVCADARTFTLDERFDAVFSNATLHWISQPELVARSVFSHLENGGRFVGEFGGNGNVAALHEALADSARELNLPTFESAHYFPTLGEWAAVLENAGFEAQFLWLFDRPTPLEGPNGVQNWLKQFCAFYLDSLREDVREAVTAHAQNALRGVLGDENGWFAPYRRLRFVAVKREE